MRIGTVTIVAQRNTHQGRGRKGRERLSMHILISNDDGYRAPGIRALADVMRRFGRVTIVAPDHNHSGASNSLSLNRPLTVEHMPGESLYVVSGTPSDCVHVALTGLIEEKPDLVLSGINCGANMGDDTMYSGTVAAAIEGYLFGVPSIAFSQIDKGWAELESAARVAEIVVERFLERRDTEEPVLLNVNMPNMPLERLRGIVGTRLGRRTSAEPVIREMSPRGFPIYWIGAAGKPADAAEGTDFWATSHGFVSVTPLQIDMTNHEAVDSAHRWVSGGLVGAARQMQE